MLPKHLPEANITDEILSEVYDDANSGDEIKANENAITEDVDSEAPLIEVQSKASSIVSQVQFPTNADETHDHKIIKSASVGLQLMHSRINHRDRFYNRRTEFPSNVDSKKWCV